MKPTQLVLVHELSANAELIIASDPHLANMRSPGAGLTRCIARKALAEILPYLRCARVVYIFREGYN
jgi:hypothetical protein